MKNRADIEWDASKDKDMEDLKYWVDGEGWVSNAEFNDR